MTTDGSRRDDPTAQADPPVPWARRPAGGPAGGPAPATGRARRMVDDLPPWEPLPPGEILVQRPRRSGTEA